MRPPLRGGHGILVIKSPEGEEPRRSVKHLGTGYVTREPENASIPCRTMAAGTDFMQFDA